ncbi:MAG: TrmH family RNA methyltransferase [bacterium]|nr:TrmH family RNA methyltransferase [bacterium]
MRRIALIVYNVRSALNVGSMLRTADGLGIARVYLCGYTPYPLSKDDGRLPHLAAKTDHQISKTALGAQNSVKWTQCKDIGQVIKELKGQKYLIVAVEQTKTAIDLAKFKPTSDVALIVGSEIGGLPQKVLDLCDEHVHIPMLGKKESFNVSIAAAIALYQLRTLA